MHAPEDLIETLEGMVQLLRGRDEHHWSLKIADDLHFLHNGNVYGAERFLTYFGGMGSLNDVWLCQENGNSVAKTDETQVNAEFHALREKAWTLARVVTRDAV